MWWIRGVPEKILRFILLFIILGGIACHAPASVSKKETREIQAFRQAARWIETGQYEKAHRFYSLFLRKFPNHVLADDVAYRLAYLHVIVDPVNPYFDYSAARTAFRRFKRTYPQSQYISACKNWLKILNSLLIKNPSGRLSAKTDEAAPCQKQIRSLQKQIQQLQEENSKLNQMLKELEEALSR